MKKIIKIALVGLLMSAVLVGCQSKPVDSGKDAITIGLVTDLGGIDDKSFNQGTWEGVKKFAAEAKLPEKNIGFLQSAQEKDYIPNLSQFADQAKTLIVAPGFLFEKAMTEVATNYPEQKFLLIDSIIDLPNVSSAIFAEHEGSFLTGVAAGLKAKAAGQKKLGFIGGMDFGLIQRFEAGFEQGVKAVLPEAEVVVEYAGDFGKPEVGQTLAKKLFDAGAYIVFHAAGNTGNGLISEAKARQEAGKEVWAIGVDIDQYEAGKMENGKSAVLTSMLKKVDVASYEVCKKVAAGEFKGGKDSALVFNIANNGVGCELTKGRNLSDDIIAEVEKYSADFKAGKFTISEIPTRIANAKN
ncbi:MAG: BMP family ABC transporter substrate-binding protein [Erysipelotrichaceae bacterium]